MASSMTACLLRIGGKHAQASDEELFRMLAEAGMEVDAEYGVVALDADRKEVLVRGQLSEEILEGLRKTMQIDVFHDLPIMPMD